MYIQSKDVLSTPVHTCAVDSVTTRNTGRGSSKRKDRKLVRDQVRRTKRCTGKRRKFRKDRKLVRDQERRDALERGVSQKDRKLVRDQKRRCAGKRR